MTRKKILKIPKRVSVKCPCCEKINRLQVPLAGTINSFECKSCKQIIKPPITQCCVICAFTKTKCPLSLRIEANAKGLELR